MSGAAKRVLIGVVVITGFALLWASIAFQWSATRWGVLAVYAFLFFGVIVGIVRRRRPMPKSTTSHPTASDEYSDLYLGRTPPTFPESGSPSMSLVEDPPDVPGSVLPPR